MNDSSFIVRNYQPADFNKFVWLLAEAEKLEPTGRSVSPQVITERLGRPNYSPEQNLFVTGTAKKIVGYMDVTPELAIGRVILECWVYPEHRRKGLATKLLGCAMQRARELGTSVAHVNIAEDNEVAGKVLIRLGFKPVRRALELRLDMAKIRGHDIEQAYSDCRHLQRGEEDKLTNIQNRAFAEHWGYNPNTIEEIIYQTNLSGCSPEDVVLLCDGDKVVGYCWTRKTGEAGDAIGKSTGQIFMLGADPDYRGKGAGKKVLLAGLAYLKNQGLPVAELTVDSENKVACALYRSIGFEVRTSSLWYEKVLN